MQCLAWQIGAAVVIFIYAWVVALLAVDFPRWQGSLNPFLMGSVYVDEPEEPMPVMCDRPAGQPATKQSDFISQRAEGVRKNPGPDLAERPQQPGPPA